MTTTAGPTTGLRLRTNAKLNLFLRVLGRRSDGYHELESIFHGIGLADDLGVRPTGTGSVAVDMQLADGLAGDVPPPFENLVSIAAQRLIERGGRNVGIEISILKRIPMGAGLGGGSGNAAGILVALNELWGMDLDTKDLHEVAAAIGSDVPYCIAGGTALATARGENLTPLPSPVTMHFVLGISDRPLLTRDVYDAWDELDRGEEGSSAPMTLALASGDAGEVALLLHNDLEAAAFDLRPDLADKKAAMEEAGALGAGMSGSGPTIFGLASDRGRAEAIAVRLEGAFDHVVVVNSTSECVEWLD